MAFLGGFKRVVERISVGGAVVGCVGWVTLMLLATANGVGRKFAYPVPNAIEMGQSLMVAGIFLGVAYVTLHRGHVNIDLLTRRLSPRIQAALDAMVNVVAVIIFGVLTWASGVVGWEAYTVRACKIAAFMWPIWPFQILLCVGLGMFVLQLVVNAITDVNKARGAG